MSRRAVLASTMQMASTAWQGKQSTPAVMTSERQDAARRIECTMADVCSAYLWLISSHLQLEQRFPIDWIW